MANIKLNNNEYPIPESKLAPAKTDLIAHLGTIAGSGLKVVIDGVEYNVDISKISSAVSGFEAALGELENGGGGDVTLAAGFYQTGAIALYNEQGAEAVEGMMIKSWDELVAEGAIMVDNGAVSVGITTVNNLPEKNEYGFYYDTTYSASNGTIATIIFHNDGSFDMYTNGVFMQSAPAGSAIYGDHAIDLSAVNWGVGTISEDGASIDFSSGLGVIFNLGGCIKLEGDLILPKDTSVTAIANNAFTGHPLTNIIISDSVISIGYGAFYNCTNLSSVVIGDGVTSIGEGAFNSCTNLKSVVIGDSVTSIDGYAFSGCSSLTSVVIPDGVTSIGNYAFQGCEVLSSVTIPGSVKTIGYEVFGRCEGLTNVTIAEGVECIGEYAFGYSFMVGTTPGTSAVYLPSTITEIQRRAFAQSGLTDVYYNGTCDQFRAINRATDAFYYTDKVVIHCTDGDYDWT